MTTRNLRVRLSVGIAAIALAGGAIACNDSTSPVRPSSAPTPQLGAAGPSLPDGSFPVSAELAEVRRATAQFHFIAAAFAAGYTTENEPCVKDPGLMGVHARNEALMGDQIIDPLKPELLLYEPRPDGGYRLVGVEYFRIVLVHDGDPATNDTPTPWFGAQEPPSDRIVGATPRLFGRSFDGPMPGHIPDGSMPWHWDLHAWIWAPNPDGMFAAFNPAIRCP